MAGIARTISAAAVALATGAALVPPAHAGDGYGDGDKGFALTSSASRILAVNDVEFRTGKISYRESWDRDDVTARIGGAVHFDGDRLVTWSELRVNERTNRVTAVVNGGARKEVLKFAKYFSTGGSHDRTAARTSTYGSYGTLLKLTPEGAASIDHAAAEDIFDAGDYFARAKRC